MELFIVRHAQSTNNALGNPQDRDCDPPLTELGRRQADVVAQHLATAVPPIQWTATDPARPGYGITRLYCSPMWRSLQTAQPIGRALGLVPEVWIDIHEHGGIYLDHGGERGIVGYPGKTRSQILAEFSDYSLPEGITEEGWWQGDHEDRAACHGRAIRVAGRLRTWADSEEHIAVVSHGGFIDALLKALFSQLPGYHAYYHQHNTAISQISFHSDGHLDVRYLNRVDHLPPTLVT
jgi:broad specificity phosphatase PhoE